MWKVGAVLEAEVKNEANAATRRPLSLLPNLFSPLSNAAKQKIREGSRIQSLQKNELVLRAGQLFPDFLVVQSGWLAAEIDDVCVSLLPPNSLYCIYMGGEPRPASFNLRAVSSSTSIAVLSRAPTWAALSESPDVLAEVCDHVIQYLAKSFADAAKRVTDPLELRLASFLWSTGTPMPDGTRRIPSVVPQQYIASYLGASREEVSRKRQLLIRSGYLSKRDGHWYMEFPQAGPSAF